MKIGIFDSGLGGLSVLHCAKKLYPEAEYIYYADEEHVPYGERTPEEIKGYVKNIFQYMLNQDVDAIVIACNTATTIVDKEYRSHFPVPIVGMEPAVKKAVDLYGAEGKRILVAATPLTIHGNKLKNLVNKVDKEGEADLIALPGLVRFAEKGIFKGPEVVNYLKGELASYELESYGTVVLGCTHFNYFKESFYEIFSGNVHFVDGNEGTIHQLMRLLNVTSVAGKEKDVEFYFSGKRVCKKEQEFINFCLTQLDKVYTL